MYKKLSKILIATTIGIISIPPILDTDTTADASGFSFGATPHYSVGLTADRGRYDGTESTLFVRLYSENTRSWSSWKATQGLEAGENAAIGFSLSASFTDVSKVQVWEGQNDGVQLTVNVLETNGEFYSYTPNSKWLKNGSSVFAIGEPATSNFNCHMSGEAALLCNRIKAVCDRIHEHIPSHGCSCKPDMSSCETGV